LSLEKYKSGERRHPPMQAVVGALQPDDLDALARWYASQPRQGQRAAEAESAADASDDGAN
ncbi:MAG: c-type cytochrome, partial [Aquimonas sp.]